MKCEEVYVFRKFELRKVRSLLEKIKMFGGYLLYNGGTGDVKIKTKYRRKKDYSLGLECETNKKIEYSESLVFPQPVRGI